MYVGKDFDPLQSGESDIFSIDFTADLRNNRTISATSWTCLLLRTDANATADPAPGNCIIGTASLSTSTINGQLHVFSNQQIGGMAVGNYYALIAQAVTSDGCTLERYSRVYCTSVN